MKYKPPSISDVGLKKWLTEKGYNYDLFVVLYNTSDKPNIEVMRRGIRLPSQNPPTRDTMRKWVEQYEKELKENI